VREPRPIRPSPRRLHAPLFAALIALSIAGCVPEMELTLSRETLAFDAVPLQGGDDEGLDVVMAVGGPAELRAWIEPEGSPFVVVEHPPSVLATGEPAFVSVRFQPDEEGQHVAILVIAAENVQSSTRRDIALEGEAFVSSLDEDRDGHPFQDDCDDEDPTVFPGADEVCDGVDNDCDELLPADESDFDNDGVSACAGDCLDDDPTTFPGAPEICDGIDNDCDGELGEQDDDGDGFRVCDGDCDDTDPLIRPGAPELCDGLDSNCDGVVFDDEQDADFDGWRGCAGDCDDSDPFFYPEAPELCDGEDNDCDSVVPEDELDADADGFKGCDGDCDDAAADFYPGAAELCDGGDTDCDGTVPPDEVDGDGDGALACADCDDAEPASFPGNPELCDGLDNDCAGGLPADEVDVDADGYLACAECDDAEPTVFPGAPELCDALDNDCDGTVPPDEVDGDSDGALTCEDCDDADPTVFPGAPELCDGLDNDCDGAVPDDEIDDDGDTFVECDGADCDDAAADVHVGAPEECYDAVDNDCDGQTNQGCTCPIWGWTVALSTCATYGTYECPWPQAQLAMNAASTSAICDEAWLRPDTYVENLSTAGEVLVRGPGDPADVILDGDGGRTFEVEAGGDVELGHLTITGGLAEAGGGLLVEDATIALVDVVFEENACTSEGAGGAALFDGATFDVDSTWFLDNDCGFGGVDAGNDGGALFVVDSTGSVQFSWFEGNTAGDGSAIFLDDGPLFVTIADNVFLDNETGDSNNPLAEIEGGALVVDSNHKIVANNLFGGNVAAAGGGGITVGSQGSSTVLLNNVLVGNESTQGAGIHFEPFTNLGGSASVQNNIVAYNDGYGVWADVAFVPTAFTYNDVYGSSSGNFGSPIGILIQPAGNISDSPQFVSWTDDGDFDNDDFHLLFGSPCEDGGNPDPAYYDADGTRNDMGIYGGPLGDWSGP
jgi:hypothetical protein